jgi:hypothetical protein
MSLGVLVSAFTGVVGASISARAQRAQGEAAKREAEYNAKLYENKALAIEYASRAESDIANRQFRRLQATQRAGFAKGGAVITEDTPLEVMLEQIEEMSLEANNNRRTRMIEAQHARAGKDMSLYQGENAVYLSRVKSRATLLGGILSGVGKIASSFDVPEKPGTPFQLDPSIQVDSFVTRAMPEPVFNLTGSQIPSYLRRP